jgi:hypothetical protein
MWTGKGFFSNRGFLPNCKPFEKRFLPKIYEIAQTKSYNKKWKYCLNKSEAHSAQTVILAICELQPCLAQQEGQERGWMIALN